MFSVLNSTVLNGNSAEASITISLAEFLVMDSVQVHTEHCPSILGSTSSGKMMIYAHGIGKPSKAVFMGLAAVKNATVGLLGKKGTNEFLTIGVAKNATIKFNAAESEAVFKSNGSANTHKLYTKGSTEPIEIKFKGRAVRLFPVYGNNVPERSFILRPEDFDNYENPSEIDEIIREYVWIIEYEEREVILMNGHTTHTFPVKQPRSRLPYDIIGDLWLEEDDYFTEVDLMYKDKGLHLRLNEVVYSEDRKRIKLWISEGINQSTHKVSLLLHTKNGLEKEVDLFFPVEDF